MTQLITFRPLYQTRVWGGRRLASFPGRQLPAEGRIGESWEVVDREEAQSVVASGPWRGLTLRELREKQGRKIFGDTVDLARPFPILVKWLDCQERLSLQVHPPQAVASRLNGEPKTENWYVAEAAEGAELLAGLCSGVTREAVLQALQDNTLEEQVNVLPVKKGDSLLVHSGCVHAIGAGTVILEIQQNSDTTYRMYDWGRLGTDGKPRELHIEESLQCIDFQQENPVLVHSTSSPQVLAEANEFRITRWQLEVTEPVLHVAADSVARLGHLVEGRVTCDQAEGGVLYGGTNFLIPAGVEFTLQPTETSIFLMTDRIRF